MSRPRREWPGGKKRRRRRQADGPGPGLYLDGDPQRGLRPETQRQILRLTEEATADGRMRRGKVYELTVRHADGCDLLNDRGPCTCRPEICQPERVVFPEEN
jgi:hypothetical protein